MAFLFTNPGTARAQLGAAHADFVVAEPVLDMFATATADADVTSQALYGTGVVALQQQGEWTQIRTADAYTGWVHTSGLHALNGGAYPAAGKLVKVAALSLNIYREPDVTKHAPLLRLPWEAILEAVPDAPGNTERWLQVRLVDGRTAWVQRGDITTSTAPVSIDEMLALAHRFLGITYTWGGVSSFGFDCSGFTQMLVRQRGIEMPRDADVQASWNGVTAVERRDLKPGDLLFFGSNPGKITHTGMYLGGGEFIHDTTHGKPGVQISRLDDEPWTHLLVAARRVKP
jgi:cell wall-associated NlpC family hydrolase